MADSIPQLIGGLFWPSDPTAQATVLLLLGLALVAVATVYLPLAVRLMRIAQLRRSVQACFDDESSNTVQRQDIANAFTESPLAYHWDEFVQRWQNAIAADPLQDASLPELSRAPVRLTDVFEEHGIIPAGARRSLVPALPATFLSAGLLGAFAGLVLALDPPSAAAATRSQQIATLMDHLGMALRIGLWGLLLSLAAAISGRVIEGCSETLSETLDSWVQLAYRSISSGELTTRTAHEQRAAIAQLHDEVAELSRQLSARPRPLIRSTASVPGAVTLSADPEAAVRAIGRLGAELSREISQEIDRSLTEQLAALRDSMREAVDGLDEQPTAGVLDEAVERLVKTSESQSAASRAVSGAIEELQGGLEDFTEAVTQMRETGSSLALSSQQVDSAQDTTNRASETLTGSLERSEIAANEHRERIEAGFALLRSDLGSVSRSLEGIDGQLAAVAASLRAELGSEMGAQLRDATAALERRLAEVATAPDRLPGASDSAPDTISTPTPAEVARSRSEDDTIPYMRAPVLEPSPEPAPERIYSQPLPRTTTSPNQASGSGAASRGSGTLSGLLRATHHSGPSSPHGDEPRPIDPEATIALEPEGLPIPRHTERDTDAAAAETHDDDEAGRDEGGNSTRRRGLFGRKK